MPRILAFDVNETLLDLAALDPLFERAFGDAHTDAHDWGDAGVVSDEELWGVTGLLHDADYERFPDMDDTESGHPRTIMAELERRDAPPEMIRGIASHADFLGVSRDSPMERTLHAVDELSGFLVACAVVRPSSGP